MAVENFSIDIVHQSIHLTIEYDYEPEDPMVWSYSDGSGYPGSPSNVDILCVLANEIDIMDIVSEEVIESLKTEILEKHEN